MECVPAYTTFYLNSDAMQQQAKWNSDIQALEADEAANPEDKATDNEEIASYNQLNADFKQLQSLVAEVRAGNTSPEIMAQISALSQTCFGAGTAPSNPEQS